MRGAKKQWIVGCLAFLLSGSAALPWAQAAEREPTIRTKLPTHWQPRTRMKCEYLPGTKMKMCDGPRRTPEPYGADAQKAERLGLGTVEVGRKLLRDGPRPEWVAAVKGQARPTLLWPVEGGRFGRGFGYVRKERRSLRHNGVDVGAPVGTHVRALNDGIVAYSDNQISGFGNTVVLVHKDRSVSFYCHQRPNYVFAGHQVKRGQVVGEVGLTGITRGPHLHFEWHLGGQARDPMPRMVGQPRRGERGPLASLSSFWM